MISKGGPLFPSPLATLTSRFFHLVMPQLLGNTMIHPSTLILAILSLILAVIMGIGAFFESSHGKGRFYLSNDGGMLVFVATKVPDPMTVSGLGSTRRYTGSPGWWLESEWDSWGITFWRLTNGSSTSWQLWVPYSYPCLLSLILPGAIGLNIARKLIRRRVEQVENGDIENGDITDIHRQ